MRVYFHEGELYAENGERVEGLMGIETMAPTAKFGPTVVRITLLVEEMPSALVDAAIEAIGGLGDLLT